MEASQGQKALGLSGRPQKHLFLSSLLLGPEYGVWRRPFEMSPFWAKIFLCFLTHTKGRKASVANPSPGLGFSATDPVLPTHPSQ